MYRVVDELKLKTKGVIKVFCVGSVIRLSEASAGVLVQQGKIEPVSEPVDNLAERMAIMGENTNPDEVLPYVTEFNSLVIPFNSPARYHYWKGGMSPCDVLKELGRCDLLDKYRHPGLGGMDRVRN